MHIHTRKLYLILDKYYRYEMEMKGTLTKYYNYEKTVPRVSIPRALAESLNWRHKDKIHAVTKVIEGKIGLFLYKEDEDIET